MTDIITEFYAYLIGGGLILFVFLWANKKFWDGIDDERLDEMRRDAAEKRGEEIWR